jgi:hypothetical protein
MPVNVTGVKELQKDLKDLDPQLNKEFIKDMANVMIPVRDKARGYMPSNAQMLSGWTRINVTKEQKYRAFPFYDQALAQNGIVYSSGKTRKNAYGFANAFYVRNNRAAGTIYEMAGRINPNGSPKSDSINPNAGIHFIQSLGGQTNFKGAGKQKGRGLYKAWAEDNGKVVPAVINAINTVVTRFNEKRRG